MNSKFILLADQQSTLGNFSSKIHNIQGSRYYEVAGSFEELREARYSAWSMSLKEVSISFYAYDLVQFVITPLGSHQQMKERRERIRSEASKIII